jgi:hypothetical protein
LAACAQSQPAVDCTDLSALSPDELQLRSQVAYQARGPNGLSCNKCFHWLAEATPNCGKCRVMPGPVDPMGYCKLFVAIR